MLTEIENVRQIPDEGQRRWFIDSDMDLILWYEEDKNKPTGFQISYDKRSVQRTVTWKSSHAGHSSLTCDGPYNKKRLIRLMEQKGSNLEPEVLKLILGNLRDQIT
ncbi:hypothetical protein [Spirochaeta isovalerica]|uniref:Uncharacterized protein n=1 Tax=Spirochaeta isovalerica TaxID=150 RepID=A0A841RDP3_9SPIO|nr:hypothetical protein [Spirochaeta isovalerica]MBB6482165.1 hypothetical protein [Spirochaeta isovalerica]